MAITMQDKITKALDNLSMAPTFKKDVPDQLTKAIKQLAETSKVLKDKITNLMIRNAFYTSNGGHH